MSTANNPHKNHRQRVRDIFLKNGYDETTPPHIILEHMLFYAIAQKDTNVIAHNLIARFGSIADVLDAPIDELVKVDGVGQNAAIMLKLYKDVFRIYNLERQEQITHFDSIDSIGDYIYSHYLGINTETLSVLGMNSNGKLLFFKFLNEGDVGSVGIPVKDVIKLALDYEATNIVIAHNHPGGLALPSHQDEVATQSLYLTLRQIGINLFDHMIITKSDYVSMRLSDEYRYIFDENFIA